MKKTDWITGRQLAELAKNLRSYGVSGAALCDTDSDGACDGAYASNVISKLRARGMTAPDDVALAEIEARITPSAIRVKTATGWHTEPIDED